MTSHEVPKRPHNNQILDEDGKSIITYVVDLIEFLKLVEQHNHIKSNIIFEDKDR
jgi:hypothetical protein